jgi:hypothetical protein
MGLDALVMCTCFARGEASPPPVKLSRNEWGLPFLDPDAVTSQEDCAQYFSWLRSCCPHPLMVYAKERVAAWGEYEAFREVLARVGWSRLPILGRELPECNEGLTAPPDAEAALRELALFRRSDNLGEGTYLVDTGTGEWIYRFLGCGDGTIVGSPEACVMLTDRGLVIVDGDFEVERFRAWRLRQVFLGPVTDEGRLRSVPTELTNLDTGETHVGASPIRKQVDPREKQPGSEPGALVWEYPSLLHVERRPVQPDEFLDIVEALERIFRASVETGNPVLWC